MFAWIKESAEPVSNFGLSLIQMAIGTFLSAASVAAMAAGTATIGCDNKTPVITLAYTTGGDVALPGVIYVALVSPDQQKGGVLDMSNNWVQYYGGQLSPNAVYESGLPSSKTSKITLPGFSSNTSEYAGYSLYAGHGALTTKDLNVVQARRDALNKAKPALMAKGAWLEQYQKDDMFKLTLVQKNMMDGNKYNRVLIIPALECDDPLGARN